ncbi:hypothetical protein BLA24_26205 [Streptomyces cinnamoneus]|uniref:ABC3 transporter permease C-terminal domain-containing protein n=2 Tax=Streptomyces cinnamoneus TaxID=53446 RepID=A0A2G1XEU5_STRCJ|nr:ABC transporter permease [Streptomyces cinnamoneus]PHQ49746.1 hypothetical protein BLA24_26205 [Streptomyces cinnamoneus]PPT16674.1 ABC transporter permease [Streptomyces cinnamoneus]
MGVRFTVTGGREAWFRTALTALGVGLGVALLMIAASVPQMMAQRQHREAARAPHVAEEGDEPVGRGPGTLILQRADTDFHDKPVAGVLLRPEGPKAPVPPGLREIPAPGEMVVSPALGRLLASADGAVLRERFPHRIVGTIGSSGLIGPSELSYYAGDDRITLDGPHGPGIHDTPARVDAFGTAEEKEPISPVLLVLAIMTCVVLLLPVAVFMATAVRFGGERRDRRLAALRLVGADARTTRRIAAGEALAGAVLGLGAGVTLFLLLREFAADVTIRDSSVFPSDMVPRPALVALIAVTVPAMAVVVTLFALRGVTIEPLGVMRDTGPRRRRLWWRLLFPVAGVALLFPLFGRASMDPWGDPLNTSQVAGGAVLLLVGITLLLPWVLQVLVDRLRGGAPAWQLAYRRLQLGSGPAARAVSGVTVAVAGAIAVQMLFAGVRGGYELPGDEASHSSMSGVFRAASAAETHDYAERFRATRGVVNAAVVVEEYATRDGRADRTTAISVGDCAELRRIARLDSCRDGDVFVADSPGGIRESDHFPPGSKLTMSEYLDPGSTREPRTYRWTVPDSARIVRTLPGPGEEFRGGVLATPSAIDTAAMPTASTRVRVQARPDDPDALERIRNTAAAIDPALRVWRDGGVVKDANYAMIERGLLIGTVGTLGLIGAGILVSTLEQLRERRRTLSALAAFGTPRSTLGWSVLWQTAIPVVLGMVLATGGGISLGWVMLQVVDGTVRDWFAFLPVTGAGAGVIALVTLASLPPLWRMTRPDGLRTE